MVPMSREAVRAFTVLHRFRARAAVSRLKRGSSFEPHHPASLRLSTVSKVRGSRYADGGRKYTS